MMLHLHRFVYSLKKFFSEGPPESHPRGWAIFPSKPFGAAGAEEGWNRFMVRPLCPATVCSSSELDTLPAPRPRNSVLSIPQTAHWR